MTLKEMAQKNIEMVEYYRATNCTKEELSEKFGTTTNKFYIIKRISSDESEYDKLKAKSIRGRLTKKHWKQQANSNEIEEMLVYGINVMLERGKTIKQIAKIFNKEEELIQRLVKKIE